MNSDESQSRDAQGPHPAGLPADMGPLTMLRSFGTLQEATLAQALLRERGIPAFVQGSEMATTMFFAGSAIGGARLQVPESRASEAATILAEEFIIDEVIGEEFPGDEIVDRALRAAVFSLFLFPFCFLVAIPLSLYALCLLGDARNAVRSDGSRRRLMIAHVFAYLSLLVLPALLIDLAVWLFPPTL